MAREEAHDTHARAEDPEHTYRWHSLRASFVVAALTHGIPIDIVRKIVGHSTVRTTEEYFNLDSAVGQGCFNTEAQRHREKWIFHLVCSLMTFLFTNSNFTRMGENRDSRIISISNQISVSLCLCVKNSTRCQNSTAEFRFNPSRAIVAEAVKRKMSGSVLAGGPAALPFTNTDNELNKLASKLSKLSPAKRKQLKELLG